MAIVLKSEYHWFLIAPANQQYSKTHPEQAFGERGLHQLFLTDPDKLRRRVAALRSRLQVHKV